MNGKRVLTLFTITICLMLITACGNNNEQNEAAKQDNNQIEKQADEKETNENNEANEETTDKDDETVLPLTQLLPYKTGYTWTYNGAVEYGHRMNLKLIDEKADKAIYTVEGEVDDVSGGESGKDYSLDVTYTVTSDTLVQEVESETMMDNNFEEIELIQMPLEEGTEWTQTQTNTEGEEVTLESSIEAVKEDGEQKIYTVTYEDTNSDYYQKRDIKEGVGVLSFEHLYIFEDNNDDVEDMPIGYEIYYDATGFDISKREPEHPEEITQQKAVENVTTYIEEHEDYDEFSVMVDREEDGKYHLRVFENQSDHIAILGWYSVDKLSGKVEAEM